MKRTAEFVTPKHPDKLADRMADFILDVFQHADKNARAAIEVLAGHGEVRIIGEARVGKLGQNSMRELALNAARAFIKGEKLKMPKTMTVKIVKQSAEIAAGVDTGGAGDQGIMWGMATRETEATGEYLPLEYCLARSLCEHLYEKYPEDGKTQITLDGKQITAIVASFANAPAADLESEIKHWLIKIDGKYPVEPAVPIEILANPAGDWKQSGWEADTGLTGRKLAVDNYAGACPCGGGAYSGKDPSKTDRSGAYMARKVALTLLREATRDGADGKTERPAIVQVRLAYAIGKPEPVDATAIMAWRDGTTYSEIKDLDLFKFDLTPNGIIRDLKLREIVYEPTARWGAYGHPGEFPWEVANGSN